MRNSSLRAIAHHEAGHAVASIWIGRPFRYVTIVKQGDSLGHMLSWPPGKWFRPDLEWSARVRSLIDAEVSVLFAGPIAEKRLTGRSSNVHADSDYRAALDLAIRVGSSERQTEAYLKWREVVAKDLIDFRWTQVEQIAGALLDAKRLTSREVRNILFPEFQLKGIEANG